MNKTILRVSLVTAIAIAATLVLLFERHRRQRASPTNAVTTSHLEMKSSSNASGSNRAPAPSSIPDPAATRLPSAKARPTRSRAMGPYLPEDKRDVVQRSFEEWLFGQGSAPETARIVELHDRLVAEKPDAEWSTTTQATIEDSLVNQIASEDDADLNIVDTTCGATLCQIMAVQPQDNATADNSGSFQRVLQRMMDEPWRSGFQSVEYQAIPTPDGQTIMVAYFVR